MRNLSTQEIAGVSGGTCRLLSLLCKPKKSVCAPKPVCTPKPACKPKTCTPTPSTPVEEETPIEG
jgi:hypothetical protein